jgi:hypothetical protein
MKKRCDIISIAWTLGAWYFPVAMPIMASYVGYRVYWRESDYFLEHWIIVALNVSLAALALWSWIEARKKKRVAKLPSKGFEGAQGKKCNLC